MRPFFSVPFAFFRSCKPNAPALRARGSMFLLSAVVPLINRYLAASSVANPPDG